MQNDTIDILIIGAGQAGLALAYYLQNEAVKYQIIERNACIGDNWRKRYESLSLFTPRFMSALPGLALEGDKNGYASRDEFAAYLEKYVQHFQIPVQLGLGIKRLGKSDEHFEAELDNGELLYARAIVVATGAFQKASMPEWATTISPDIQQLNTETYLNSAQIKGSVVLVVGDGASGRDIARELAESHQVLLATGRPRRLMPEHILGTSTWWWLDKLGVLKLSGESLLGHTLKESDSFPARGNRLSDLKEKGVKLVSRLMTVRGKQAEFANHENAEVDVIIWATGYQDETNWVSIPEAKDAEGRFIHHQGISPVPNLYYLGRPWQRNRRSALIAGAGEDALWLKEQILTRLGNQ